ncbi:MAG: hypothetical protein K2K22_07345 [Muribaculaceae bacterium]|nr:hypothetical protein [Muribaculaceae bacterium]
MPVSTPTYSVAASAYVNAEARRFLVRWWWLLLPAPLALAIAGASGVRYLYLCLMLTLIVYPMALSFMWITLACRPAMAMLTRPQHLQFGDNGITLCFHSYDADNDEPDSIVHSIEIDNNSLAQAENHGKYLHVYIDRAIISGPGYILVPSVYRDLKTSDIQE